MTHPYPKHLKDFSYIGKYQYFLTFCCADDTAPFVEPAIVTLVLTQILRAANEKSFEITAYCFMPDHLHLLVKGITDASNCRAFIKAAKQYSGYYFSKNTGRRLWQRYAYEHLLKADIEQGTIISYILDNPLRAGLAERSSEYPFLGSQVYGIADLEELATESNEANIPRRATRAFRLKAEATGQEEDSLPPEGGSHRTRRRFSSALKAEATGQEEDSLPPEGGSHRTRRRFSFA